MSNPKNPYITNKKESNSAINLIRTYLKRVIYKHFLLVDLYRVNKMLVIKIGEADKDLTQ